MLSVCGAAATPPAPDAPPLATPEASTPGERTEPTADQRTETTAEETA
ncbi:MAG: hypothetical protein JO168_27285 [Solirubrobacterales bacterium]|nr:hypothetical protein [Solirubrobacterales bacterium]